MLRSIRRLLPFGLREWLLIRRRRLQNLLHPPAPPRYVARTNGMNHVLFEHRAPLFRDYPEPWYSLQQGKVANLRRALPGIDGAWIEPGAEFSFWAHVGPTGTGNGYVDGMVYQHGTPAAGTGGGLCQLSNALLWCALNTGMRITERHRHSLDPFPDSGRSVPFGCGATVHYNYLDFRFINTHAAPIRISAAITGSHLVLGFSSDVPLTETIRIEERDHRFTVRDGRRWRENRIIRIRVRDDIVTEEQVLRNSGRVLYDA